MAGIIIWKETRKFFQNHPGRYRIITILILYSFIRLTQQCFFQRAGFLFSALSKIIHIKP